MKSIQQETAECYQPLFDLLSKEHGITLLTEEMDAIREAVRTVEYRLDNYFKVLCDVEGCNDESCNGNEFWRETGFWNLCLFHFSWAKRGLPQPKMKIKIPQ